MPLSQDDPNLDYDGSWADASKGWPSISFPTEVDAQDAYVVAWKVAKVPYGSYVLVGKELRLETHELKMRVEASLRGGKVRKVVDIRTEETVLPIEEVLNRIGISFSHVSLRANGFEVARSGSDLTFAQLAELSRVFGTKDIDLSCDTGTGSDLCHDGLIIVRGASREA